MRKIVIITGCSSGIGKELATLYLQERAVVFGIGIDDFKLPNLVYIKCDLTDYERVDKIIEKITSSVPYVDLLINNAGIGYSGPSENMTLDKIKHQFDVNLISQIYLTNALLPWIKKSRQGKISFTSSLAASFPLPYQTLYSASKAALSNYGLALANELKPFGIQVVVNELGDVATRFTENRTKIAPTTDYASFCVKQVTKQELLERTGAEPYLIATKIKENLDREESLLYFAAGKNAKLQLFLKRFLSHKQLNKLINKHYSK